MKIVALPTFCDNYIWLIVHPQSRQAVCVDPGDSKPVIAFLEQNQLTLNAILITHHHHDHTGGVTELRQHTLAKVFAPSRLRDIASHVCQDDDMIELTPFGCFRVIATPGHTLDHLVYAYNQSSLFTGDTLFSGGCGRLFEGTAEQMFNSLKDISSFAEHTLVYCAHEYTEANLSFAQLVEPENEHIQRYHKEVRLKRKKRQPSLPSTIGREKKINPFLRCHLDVVRESTEKYFNKSLTSPVDVFGHLREWKNAS